jgi:hypothetical protein
MLEKRCSPQLGAGGDEFFDRPRSTFPLHSLLQAQVALEQVVAGQRRRLVENIVCARAMFHESDLAPGAAAVLDSQSMHSSSSKSRSFSLLLLLRR